MGAPQIPSQNTEKKETKGLLDFVSPTQFILLPSEGRGYPEGHPLGGKESIEVRYMTAKDEDILSSPALLKKGIAIDRFLENVLMDKKFPVDSLLIGDKNAILIGSRISGYGNLYETEMTCPSCGAKNGMTFDLNNKHITSGCEDGKNEKGNYELQLPVSKVNLEIRLLRSKDEKAMIKKIAKIEKTKGENTTLTDQYKMMILTAQGETDRSLINQFVDLMPIEDSRALRDFYKQKNPTIEIIDIFECRSCEYEQELEVPFGADFFWPKS